MDERLRLGTKPAVTRRWPTAELFGLWALAGAQPIFDLLRRGPEFLVAHRLGPWELVLLTLGLSFALPALVALVGGVFRGVSKSFGLAVQALALTAGTTLLAWQILIRGPEWLQVATPALGVLAGVGVAWATHRSAVIQGYFRWLSLAALLVPILFVVRDPVWALLWPEEVAAAGDQPQRRAPVVFLVFDELPLASLLDIDGRIDADRYRSFARLAERSIWFRQATTVAESTTKAIPALLTGSYPEDPQHLPIARHYPNNLFTWLGNSMELNVTEQGTGLCPASLQCSWDPPEPLGQRLSSTFEDLAIAYLHIVLPRPWSARLPAVESVSRDFRQTDPTQDSRRSRGDVLRQVEGFLNRLRSTEPALHYLHLNLPHLPWKYLPSGKEYGPLASRIYPWGMVDDRWVEDEWASIQALQRHLLQLGFADRLLGRILDHLEANELFEQSLVVVVADHGISFWPGDYVRLASDRTAAEILRVPLLVKLPGQVEGRIDDRWMETVDLLPTIAEVLEAELPWPVDGRSMLSSSAPGRKRRMLATHGGAPVLREIHLDTAGPEAAVRRRLDLFGDAADPDALFRTGRHQELWGAALDGLEIVSDQEQAVEVEIVDAASFERVDLDSRYLPARVVGRLLGGRGSRELALALNGRIRALGRSRENGRFMMMVPESAFRQGLNRVEIFEVDVRSGKPRLTALSRRESATYRLELDGSGNIVAVVGSDGRRLAVRPGALRGKAKFTGSMFQGWAVDVEAGRPAEEVLFFYDGRFITRAPIADARPWVEQNFRNPALRHSGYGFVVPFGEIGQPRADLALFLAISGDVAVPLSYKECFDC